MSRNPDLPYQPREGSLAHRVVQYFVANPDEELNATDIGIRFDAPAGSVATSMTGATDSGLIAVRKNGLAYVYSAGPRILAGEYPEAAAAPQATAADPFGRAKPPKAARKLAKAFAIDVRSIAIEVGVPIPTAKRTALDWSPVFALMNVGDSFALPAEAKSAITSAITQRHKATKQRFTQRRDASGSIRVWRTA